MNHWLYLFLWILGALLGSAADSPTPLPSVEPWPVSGAVPPVFLRGVSKPIRPMAEALINKQLKLAEDTSASAPLADDLAFFLGKNYRDQGFREAQVDWTLQDGTIVLSVLENAACEVGEITINGVEPEMTGLLLPYVTRPTRERMDKGENAALPFVQSEVEAGADLARRKLQAEGYLDATAQPPVFTTDTQTAKVDITLAFEKGPRYTFAKVSLLGDTSLLSEPFLQGIRCLSGQPFSEVTLETQRKDVVTHLQTLGYYAAAVTASHGAPTPGSPTVSATLTIEPGEPFIIRDLRIADQFSQGARRMVNSIYHAALNRPYKPVDLQVFTRRALETGIYGRLDVEPTVAAPGELALTISGTEANRTTMALYGGYETFLGPGVGAEIRNVNFLDTGDTALLKAEWNALGVEGRIGWKDPAIWSTGNSLAIDLSVETFSFKAFTRRTAALQASLTRRFSPHTTAEIYAGFSINGTASDELLPTELGPDSYALGLLGMRLQMDYRDNPLLPHRGWLASVGLQGVSGDVTFTKLDVSAAYYHPLTERWRFAIGAESSTIQTSAELSEIPLDLRNFNGGANSVRSFGDREMGVHSLRGDNPLGNFAYSALSAELSYELMTSLELAAFADIGTLGDAQSVFALDELRYGVGLGFRYNLPIGPLRIDYGFNPDKRSDEKRGALQITFGFAF